MIADALARAAAARASGAAAPTDAERIVALPARPPPLDGGAAEAEAWTRALRRVAAAPPLRPVQGRVLSEVARAVAEPGYRGVFGSIGVGHGKTLITLLTAEVACAERPLLLVPPAMRDQLRADVAEWQRWYHFEPPRVLAYSELSTAKATTFLEYTAPDLIVADEAHALARSDSARGRRFFRFLREHPECRVVLLSGTITQRSLLDHAALLEAALRDRSPLPFNRPILEQWASVIDPDGEPDERALSAVAPLVAAFGVGGEDAADEARRAYHRRLISTPGVVATSIASVDVPLTLTMITPRAGVPSVISDALGDLAATWTLPTPDAVADEEGEAVVDAATMARAAGALATGFVYSWAWPEGKRDEEWLRRRSEYARAVRSVLRYSARAGLDSPLLVWRHCMTPGRDLSELRAAWRAWTEPSPTGERWCDRPRPPTVCAWLDSFVIDDVVARAREAIAGRAPPVLIWYQSRAVGDALAARGLRVYGAGSATPPTTDRAPVVSISVHGKGKNMQSWAANLVIEPPSSGATWEQLIGRTHRQGQGSPVTVDVYAHAARHRAALETATERARYIETTQGTPQKLVYAARSAPA